MNKNNKEIYSKRIKQIRELMQDADVDAYLIPMSDPHGSEMLDAHYHEISFVTGFTGSAGDVLLTKNEGFLWTDSRYFLQAAEQLPPEIKLMKLGCENTELYDSLLFRYSNKGLIKTLAVDMGVYPTSAFSAISQIPDSPKSSVSSSNCDSSIKIKDYSFVDKIWKDRPPVKSNPIINLDISTSGESTESKLSRVQEEMKKHGADYYFVSALDDVAWFFNKRGSDFDDSPLFYSYALISLSDAKLYTLRDGTYNDIYDDLRNLPSDAKLIFDPSTTPCRVLEYVNHIAQVIEIPSPTETLKSVKNNVELAGMRRAHLHDGLALTRFVHYLKTKYKPSERVYRESELSEILNSFRKESSEYNGPSFEPILGFGANGAVVHYSFLHGKDSEVSGNSLLLVDTGGQYQTGTTDVTRTIAIGSATKEMSRAYTAVLKGHLALARAKFSPEELGASLDEIPKSEMAKFGYSYGHGTGHGVGHMLNVHEGPISISPRGNLPLQEGNVVSNEPGVYLEGKFGIRIENLVEVCGNSGSNELFFSNLTLCPYDTDLIDAELLSAQEKNQIYTYHKDAYSKLHDFAEKEYPEILEDNDFWEWFRGLAQI